MKTLRNLLFLCAFCAFFIACTDDFGSPVQEVKTYIDKEDDSKSDPNAGTEAGKEDDSEEKEGSSEGETGTEEEEKEKEGE